MMESMMMMAAAIFLLLVLADFSLADTPQDRISGRMYVRFLSGWQTVCAAFSKKGTLEKFDNPAICLSTDCIRRFRAPRRCRKSNRKVFLLPVASETQKYRIASAQTI